ncbi:hypothetical protein L1987_88585 [Smallanthus sonchifolius]|nr:hypothetical protein L1987_89491 [Smallanthus sonchifolius]KAI3666298.1 hypothetical protein L1987_89201 [Smallanthus sonchifolius]KAI3668421.1 hypothetical protein L1987_88585 [Smallanthus sonchifolius]
MDYATWPLQIKEKSYASDTNRAHLEKRNHQLLIQLNQRKRSEKAERSQCEKAKKSRVIYCTAKLANRDLFSQEPDLHARRRTYLSGHILVELLSSRSLWFLGPASHLLALIVHIQRRGKLNKQAIQVDFIESEKIKDFLRASSTIVGKGTDHKLRALPFLYLDSFALYAALSGALTPFPSAHFWTRLDLLLGKREREGSLVRPDIDLPRKTPMPKDICQAVMYRIQEKLLHIVSNGEKLSSNRRGGTARSFGDKCFLRRSDPVERKSSSFFSSLRKAIVNIRAEVVSE